MEQILKRLDLIESRLDMNEDKVQMIEDKVQIIENITTNQVKEINIISLKKKDNYIKFINEEKFKKITKGKKTKTYMNAIKIYEYIYHKENYISPIKICNNKIILYYNDTWSLTTTPEIIRIILCNIRDLYIQLNKNINNVNEFTKNQEYIIKLSDDKFKKKFTLSLIKLEKNRLI